MLFSATEVDGAVVIDLERQTDDRGYFARTFCVDEFGDAGLDVRFPQTNVSSNIARGTLRGMHVDIAPAGHPPSRESKVVRCTAGAIFDVIIDLREHSPTYRRTASVELSRTNGRALYVPPGCAHGFVTLVDDVDVHYMMGSPHRPGIGRGVRWDDPAFEIQWPIRPIVISTRDATYPDWTEWSET